MIKPPFKGKKLLALALSLTMAGSMLFGCSAKPTPTAHAYTQGTYYATGTGLGGTIEFEVTFDANSITDVSVLSHYESANIGGKALTEYVDALLKDQDIAKVEAVSGATVTYDGFVEAMTSAVGQATGKEDVRQHTDTQLSTEDMEVNAQVLVVGCGYSGLVAAISAAEEGVRVVVLEKGNSYANCGHSITACNTPWQEATGQSDSVEALTRFWLGCGTALGCETVDEEMIRFAAEQSASGIQWLTDQGVEFVGCTMAPTNPFQSPFRTHVTTASRNGQKAYMEPLYNRAQELGIEILFDTTVTELLQNDAGAVIGVKAANEARTITVHADAVILATGKQGEGQGVAEAVGAHITGNEEPMVSPSNMDGADGDYAGAAMYVTEEGTRFINEHHYFMHRAAYARSLGMHSYYGIFDSEMIDGATLETGITNGSVVKADTIEELAGKLGMNADTLANTVAKYNGYCDTGVDEEFGKPAEATGYVFDPDRANEYDVDSIEKVYHLLNRIDTAPYYAVTYVVPHTSNTNCTININTEVLDSAGSAIPGLYANGEVARAQIFGLIYPQSGVSLSFYLTYGRVAGQNAAKYAQSK